MSRQENPPMTLSTKMLQSSRSPKTYCCMCSEHISDGYDRRHLWQTEDRKSRICTLVEQVLRVNIIKSVHTEFICRPCFTKVKSLKTKIQSTRDEIDAYAEQIGRHGAAMKCMKRDIRERITATETETPLSQRRGREMAVTPVGQLFTENNFPSVYTDLSPNDGHQQSALASTPLTTSLLPGSELELVLTPPGQCGSHSQSSHLGRSASGGSPRLKPRGLGRSASSTQHNHGESTSTSTHNSDRSNDSTHKVWDRTTDKTNTPGNLTLSDEQHTYCRTNASHDDVRIPSDILTKDVREIVRGGTDLETACDHVIKAEKCDAHYPDLGVNYGDKTKPEARGLQYLVPEVRSDDDDDTIKREDDISQYIDTQLADDNRRTANGDRRQHAVRRKRPRRLWKCSSCPTVCLSRSALAIHDRVHTGVKPYTCSTCGRSFAQTSCLKTHARTHTGERPYTCATCGKAYGAASELKIHERTHRGERPYLCATCGKSFVSSSNLCQHETTHVRVRTYACPTCDKTFVCYSHLTRHRKIHTGVRPHKCSTCGRSFVRGHHLTRHIRSLHSSSE